ncbi:MAG: DEAD/DEAH box helicase [Brevinema sp.]
MAKDSQILLLAYVDFSGHLASSIKIDIQAPQEILDILSRPFPHVRLFAEAPRLPTAEKNALLFVQRLKKESKKELPVLTPPFDAEFLTHLFNAPTRIFLPDGTDFMLSSVNRPYNSKLILSISKFSLNFQSQESSVLFLSYSAPIVLHKRQLLPLQSPLPLSNLDELYRTGSIVLSPEEILFYLQKQSVFSKFLSAPKLCEPEEIKPIFEFHYQKDRYEIHIFVEATIDNKRRLFPLTLEYARDIFAEKKPLLLHNAHNMVLHISEDHSLRGRLEDIVGKVFHNFYSILGEVSEHKIITKDRTNLFEGFLPSISDSAEIVSSGKERKTLRFILASESPEISIKGGTTNPSEIDWLAVNFEYNHQSVRLSLKDLEEILQKGFIEKDGMIISLPEKELNPLEKLLNLSKKRDKGSEIKMQSFFLPWLLAQYPNMKIPSEWKDLEAFIKDGSVPDIPISEDISNTLRDYQKIGIKRLSLLHRFGFGTVLADEMGLGKTLQVLTFLDLHHHEGKILIVTPSALIYNWLAEIEKFYPHRFKTLVINGSKADRSKKMKNMDDYDIIITSYHTLGFDIETYKDKAFRFLIIDEAHHIKNKKAKRSKSVKMINARTRIAVSGTPLENNIGELWSVFDFIMPGFLGSTKDFQEEFEDPLRQFDISKRKDALSRLQMMTSPFIIRRTKTTVYKELPPKIEQSIMTELTEKQKSLYLETLSRVRNHYFDLLAEKSFGQTQIDFLSALTKLRQIALHPALVYPDLVDHESEEISSKISALNELLDEAFDSNHRVLIFSQFVSMLGIIRKELEKQSIPFFYIDGKTASRVDLANEFNKSDVPVFLISLKAGGVGLNLTGADTVILFDPWWNPAVENQAIDRTHRIGQNKTVNVYRLMTKGTIEEKIYNLQQKKSHVFESLMQEDPDFGAFSKDELLSLLSEDGLE